MITPSAVGIIIAVIVAAEALGWIAQKLGQPKVLGELATGLILGGSAFGILDPHQPLVSTLSDVGLLVLLFSIGLHTDIKALARVGRSALLVGTVGVVLPFILGWGAALAFDLGQMPAILCGAALTATSIGISARVLQDLGVIDSVEGRIVLGAAVLDDVAGLVILGVVSSMAGTSGGGSSALLHSVAMLAAFAVGMALYHTPARARVERGATILGVVVVPVFFAAVGAAVQIAAIAGWHGILLCITLLLVGVIGKFVAGYATPGFQGNKALVGWAMVPRGEVGLVFATTALAAGVFDNALFSIVTLVIMATTFLTPPVLTRVVRSRSGDTIGAPAP